MTSSEEWSDADLYVGSLWKAVLTILQAQEHLLQLVDQWTSMGIIEPALNNPYVPSVGDEKGRNDTMNVQQAGVQRSDTV